MGRWAADCRMGCFVAHFASSLYTQNTNDPPSGPLVLVVWFAKQYAGRAGKFQLGVLQLFIPRPQPMKPEIPWGAAAELTAGQRALLHQKIHIRPDALARSRGDLHERLPSAWQAAIEIAHSLRGLPEDALLWWAEQAAGHILLTADERGYRVDPVEHGDDLLRGVALIPLRQILGERAQAAMCALQPLDHLLGCGGADGPWLSDGGGVSPRWAQIGGQIASLFALSYGLSEDARNDPHLYLAEGLWTAIHDRRRLNVADPKLARLLQSSLLSASFWRRFRRE